MKLTPWIIAAVWLAAGCGIPVETTEVTRRTVREFIAEDAVTRLGEDYLIDMPISGTLERVRFEVGDVMEQGEVIARVDAFALQQQIKEIESLIAQIRAQTEGVDVAKPKQEEIEQAVLRVNEARDAEEIARKERAIAEADFEDAQKRFRRAQELLAEQAVSQSFYDEADRAFKSAQENLARAKIREEATQKSREIAELALKRLRDSVDDNEYLRDAYQAEIDGMKSRLNVMKNDLKKAEIRAPIRGPVLEKFVDARRVLTAGQPILRLGDLDSIEIECDVLSEEIGRVRVGDRVEIAGKALFGKTAWGTVKRIYPAGFKKISALGIEQQRVRTILAFDNSEVQLRPGTSVDVRIITNESENTLAVPERSTFRHQDGWAVFKVESGTAVLTPVTLGLKNDDWAEIKEGLAEGDAIIADPTNDIADGTSVQALESDS